MDIKFADKAEEAEYSKAWDKYLEGKTFKLNVKATPFTKTKMTTKERKQLLKSWNKLAREQVRLGTTVHNYTSSLYNEGYEQGRKSQEAEILRLKTCANSYNQQRAEAAFKLANAMSQNTNALAQALDELLTKT